MSLSEKQLENVKDWLERFYSRAGESYEPEDTDNFFDIHGCAAALAPALEAANELAFRLVELNDGDRSIVADYVDAVREITEGAKE